MDLSQNGYHCTETSFNVLGKYIYIHEYIHIFIFDFPHRFTENIEDKNREYF